MCNADVPEHHIDATSRLSLPSDKAVLSNTWLVSWAAKDLAFPMPWVSLVAVIFAILKQQLDHPQPIETSLRGVQHILRYPRGAPEFYHRRITENLERERDGCIVLCEEPFENITRCIASHHQSSSQYYTGGIYVSIEQSLCTPL